MGDKIDKRPLVSVVISFLNGEKFIQEAVESVLAQTYDSWELWLVDDGSTDTSTRIALEYATEYPGRMFYLEHDGHENRGVCVSRNMAIRRARGEYIALLDVDDVWLPHKLERQVAILHSNPRVDMVVGMNQMWFSWTGNSDDLDRDYTPSPGVRDDTLFEPNALSPLLYPLGEGTSAAPSSWLLTRELFELVGGFEETFRGKYQLYEDQAFLAKVYANGSVFVASECLDRHRVHPDSCVSVVKAGGHYHTVRLFFLGWLKAYLTEQRVNDTRVWAALQRALGPYGRSISEEKIAELDPREIKWSLRAAGGNIAQLVFPTNDPDVIRIAIEKAETKTRYHIQLYQPQLKVESNHGYSVHFRGRADSPRSIFLAFVQAHEPWTALGLYKRIDLTSEWQNFQEDFVATEDDYNGRILFDIGESDISVELCGGVLCNLQDGQVIEPSVGVLLHYPSDRWKDGSKKSSPAASCATGNERGLSRNPMQGPSNKSEIASPRFSVVIPTYQRRDLVLSSVQALTRQEFNNSFEVIVVVDGSGDGTADALRELDVPFPFTVLEQPNFGAATARNRGAAAARGEILLFLDDDMEAHPRLLAEHDRSHQEGADVVLGHFPLHLQSPANFLSSAVKSWTDERGGRLSSPGASLTLQDLLTGQISVSRNTFKSIGGFDTDFTRGGTFGNEDVDFGYRLLLKGYKAIFNPYAISYQNYIVQPRHYLRQTRQAGHADVAFARKYPDQAKTIFAFHGSEKGINRWLWRPMADFVPFTVPLVAALRWLALTLVECGCQNTKAVKFFYQVRSMEYWRGVREAGGMPRPRPLRVLSYHAIKDLVQAPVIESYGTPPDSFRRQMKALQRAGFHFVSADEFLHYLHGGGLPRLPLLLTFDDGYEELSDVVLPILKERGIPAVAFAISQRLGGTNEWDEAIGAPRLRLLDVNGLRTLARGGIEIGGHSRTHRPLTGVSDEELFEEVAGSVEDLEAVGLDRPRLFAYPYGVCDERVRQVVGDAGLQAAFTVNPGRVQPGHDPYQVPRIEIMREDTGWKFLWKVIMAGR